MIDNYIRKNSHEQHQIVYEHTVMIIKEQFKSMSCTNKFNTLSGWKNAISCKHKTYGGQMNATKIEIEDTIYVCKKCGSRKFSRHEKQTRSADEPMTQFFQCLECKKKMERLNAHFRFIVPVTDFKFTVFELYFFLFQNLMERLIVKLVGFNSHIFVNDKHQKNKPNRA